jgi:hypothetical protein
MVTIDLNNNKHEFEKQNLVTTKGGYDILKCVKCGIQGKTNSISTISVKSSYSKNKILSCIHKVEDTNNIGRTIRITEVFAFGEYFYNLTPNSEHTVIKAPTNYKDDLQGVWVMGVGQPVKVLNEEFVYKSE